MLLGALAFALLNKKSSKEKAKERNLKLATYIPMVFIIYVSMAYLTWMLYIISAALIFIAMREVLNASRNAGKPPYLPLAIAGLVLYFFAQFINAISPEIQLFTYLIIVHFDGFSQVIGESIGRQKMVPKISPGKTWAGFLGGSAVAFLVSIIIYKCSTLGQSLLEVEELTAIIIVSGLAGDLLASYYKRSCGIKNYSRLLPGHGGVLDRFDSFFMAGAIIQAIQWFYAQS